MKSYDLSDRVTFYFVCAMDNNGNHMMIKGWSVVKAMIDAYMKFHQCPSFYVKKITDTWENIVRLLNEETHDEIKIANLITKNRSGKRKKDPVDIVSIPITDGEHMHVNDQVTTTCSTYVDYTLLNKHVRHLKQKYREALAFIGLNEVIDKEIRNKDSRFMKSLILDELMILVKFFPAEFGGASPPN
jgi:hypothetical protein